MTLFVPFMVFDERRVQSRRVDILCVKLSTLSADTTLPKEDELSTEEAPSQNGEKGSREHETGKGKASIEMERRDRVEEADFSTHTEGGNNTQRDPENNGHTTSHTEGDINTQRDRENRERHGASHTRTENETHEAETHREEKREHKDHGCVSHLTRKYIAPYCVTSSIGMEETPSPYT